MLLTDLKPGETLGRYEILMPVAKGGMAEVWAARMVGSRGFQKIVAIKTMLPDLSDDPDFEAMFLDEARLAARIRHPHAVEIVDLGDEDGLVYIVMEWVDGETIFTLNKRAKSKGGIPLPVMLRIASCACAGLHAAHELRDDKGQLLGLVHRDVSPQNVMVSFDGIVKIVDFGVAKAAGRLHETRVAGIMKGKVPYLSPEQLTNGKVDRRADIFSLGILLYAMISGYHPFRGETDVKTMENICTRTHVPLRELVPSVPAALEDAVDRALAKDPGARWADCAALQRALDLLASEIGPPVTDGDVARVVRATLGDIIEERRKRLAVSIQMADARLGGGEGRQKRVSGVRPAARGGAPLPATYAGILPVALDDGSAPKPQREIEPEPEPKSDETGPPAPAAVVPRGRRSRRIVWPYVVLAVVALAGGAVVAMRAGVLGVPDPLRRYLPPSMFPPAPGQDSTTEVVAPAPAAAATPTDPEPAPAATPASPAATMTMPDASVADAQADESVIDLDDTPAAAAQPEAAPATQPTATPTSTARAPAPAPPPGPPPPPPPRPE